MWTPIGVLWTLLSMIVAALCGFSFLQPCWFIHRDSRNSLGMFSYCIQDGRASYGSPDLPQVIIHYSIILFNSNIFRVPIGYWL